MLITQRGPLVVSAKLATTKLVRVVPSVPSQISRPERSASLAIPAQS